MHIISLADFRSQLTLDEKVRIELIKLDNVFSPLWMRRRSAKIRALEADFVAEGRIDKDGRSIHLFLSLLENSKWFSAGRTQQLIGKPPTQEDR